MAALTQATLVQRIRRDLSDAPFIDICTEAMDTTETGLDVADTTKYAIGTILEYQDDGEQCMITALASATTLTVIRNWNYSVTTTTGTGTSHNINTPIAADPTYYFVNITEKVNECLRDLWPYVYIAVAQTIAPVVGTRWYAATAGILDFSTAVQMDLSSPARPFFYASSRTAYPVELRFGLPTASFASGAAWYIPFWQNTTNSLLITGIREITSSQVGVAGTYDDLLEGVQADCIRYYTVGKLIGLTDVTRTTQQDQTMGDQTVRPLVRTQLAGFWEAKGLEKRHQWEMELKRTLPRRHVWGHR